MKRKFKHASNGQVPKDVQIELDTNGLRTFASIANLPPSSQATTIISHEFHLKRAAFIATGLENRFSSSRLVSHSAHGPPNPAGERHLLDSAL